MRLLLFLLSFLSGCQETEPDLRYSNYSGSFTFKEMNFKERNFEMCIRKFNAFKATGQRDTVLYRVSGKKVWNASEYSNSSNKEKYALPYLEWEEIEKRRGPLENKSGFQDF